MAGFVQWDDRELVRFTRDLKRFAAQAVPFANRNTLNDAAFMAREVAKKELGKRLTLRNKWTTSNKQLLVEKATQKRIRDQRAVFGARDEYLERTEFGGTVRSKSRHGVPIPTRSASGEGRGGAPRARAVRPKQTRRAIRLRVPAAGMSRKQRNLVTVKQAIKSGRRFVFMRIRQGKGIFKIMGSRSKPRVEMMWDLSRKAVRVGPTPWLAPTIAIVRKRMPGIYRKNLKKQLLRRRLFTRR